MKTQLFIPPPSISPYVSSILVIEDSGGRHDFVIPLFANGSPTMVFQTVKAARGKDTIGHLTMYGQTIRPDELVLKDGFRFIAYFFYPHALLQLFGVAPKEITDGYLDLNLLKQTKSFNLQNRLLDATTLTGSLDIIEQYILKLAENKTDENSQIVFATNKLKDSHGLLSLPALQSELNITERTFQRLFESNVGISPKMYKRICQFQFSFQQINQYNFLRLTDLAYDSGFADQSHFIRVFKEFTGLTPNEYLAKLAPYKPRF